MRIGINFHASDKYISGVEYYALGLLDGLLRVDTENDYFIFTNQPDLVNEHTGGRENLQIIALKHLTARVARIIWEHSRLPRIAARMGLDVLHCVSYINPLCQTQVPYVVTVHDTIALGHPEWCKLTNALYFNLAMKRSIKKASQVIAVSKCTARDLRRNCGVSSSKVRTIYPGIERIFRAKGDLSRQIGVRARYNLPQRYVLYVGNIEPKKNIWTLLCIQKRLQGKGLPHKLVIVGKRSWNSRVELGEIADRVRSGGIVRVGYVERDDLPSVYQMADVFIFPSAYEGFGFPPLEAMACGTPVVSSHSGALGETIRGPAMTFDPYDWLHMAQAVVSIINDSSLRRKHVEMGIERSNLFTWERAARETVSVYEEAASTGHVGTDTRITATESRSGQMSVRASTVASEFSYGGPPSDSNGHHTYQRRSALSSIRNNRNLGDVFCAFARPRSVRRQQYDM